eukprot:1241102-Rhodomonas_salina.3
MYDGRAPPGPKPGHVGDASKLKCNGDLEVEGRMLLACRYTRDGWYLTGSCVVDAPLPEPTCGSWPLSVGLWACLGGDGLFDEYPPYKSRLW